MEAKWWYLIVGIGVGWLTKVPFLLKWYKELRKTRSYERMKDMVHVEELRKKYNELYPDKKILQ